MTAAPTRRGRAAPTGPGLGAGAGTGPGEGAAPAGLPLDLPASVRVLPTTATSRPTGTGLAPGAPVDLDDVGYEEIEYLVSGTADVWAEGVTLAADAPYTTRMLVRRPRDRTRFSGTVHIEPFHQSAEAQPTWDSVHQYIIARGHAWAGLTVFGAEGPAGGTAFLQGNQPDRYADLELRCPRGGPLPPTTPGIEALLQELRVSMAQGAVIITQVARLLRSGRHDSPLAGHDVSHVYGSGWSGTGMFWQEFIDDRHAAARLPDGRPVFDGYVAAIHRAPVTRPADAVVAVVLSEGEVWGMAAAGVTSSADESPRFRIYEVPGSTHSNWTVPRAAARRPGSPDPRQHDGPHNRRSFHRLAHAIFANLDRGARDGTPMPAAARIERDPASPDGLARDQHGNARGGLRTAWVDVPSARYLPRCRCTQVLGYSPLIGAYQPFDAEKMKALYGRESEHVRRWDARVEQMVTEGWLLPDDADALRGAPQ